MTLFAEDPKAVLADKRAQMDEAVAVLDFETAAIVRDEIRYLEGLLAEKKKARKKAPGR